MDTVQTSDNKFNRSVMVPFHRGDDYQLVKFINLVAKGMPPTTAYRKVFPAKAKLQYDTVRALAFKLMADNDIQMAVQTRKTDLARLARLSEERLEGILTEDASTDKNSKVADVAMFIFDHANGKAKQTTETINKSVSVNIDLSGDALESSV